MKRNPARFRAALGYQGWVRMLMHWGPTHDATQEICRMKTSCCPVADLQVPRTSYVGPTKIQCHSEVYLRYLTVAILRIWGHNIRTHRGTYSRLRPTSTLVDGIRDTKHFPEGPSTPNTEYIPKPILMIPGIEPIYIHPIFGYFGPLGFWLSMRRPRFSEDTPNQIDLTQDPLIQNGGTKT